VQQLGVTLPGVFEEPTLAARELALDAQIKGPDAQNWFVDVTQLHVVNDDLDVRLQGQWRREGKTAAGSADMRGTMVRGSMPSIPATCPWRSTRTPGNGWPPVCRRVRCVRPPSR